MFSTPPLSPGPFFTAGGGKGVQEDGERSNPFSPGRKVSGIGLRDLGKGF